MDIYACFEIGKAASQNEEIHILCEKLELHGNKLTKAACDHNRVFLVTKIDSQRKQSELYQPQ